MQKNKEESSKDTKKHKDSLAKEYIANNVIFADLINFYFFDGEKKVKESDLKELDTTSVKTLKQRFQIQRYRDLIKEACIKEDSNNTYIIFGIENQSEEDKGMVFRCMIYDALSYLKQLDNIEKPNKNDKIKLKPVITLVLYLGNGEWNGPKSLYEMVDMEKYQFIKDRIYDYKLHLISPYEINNEDFIKLKSEMRLVLKCIKYSKDSMKLNNIIKNDGNFNMVSNKAAELIDEVVETEFAKNAEGGYVNMCKAIEDMKKEARLEGVVETEARVKVETVVNFYKNGASLELISKSTKMTIEEVKNILLQNNVELRTA
ncbi:MAG: Rpn family recombination-promoting nuclease/putative transposase [Acholeplasmatales bacterium]|nr:Rpn family recombination-promoting nuclease/putative transposase [Acholeplasmatales bacterium]